MHFYPEGDELDDGESAPRVFDSVEFALEHPSFLGVR